MDFEKYRPRRDHPEEDLEENSKSLARRGLSTFDWMHHGLEMQMRNEIALFPQNLEGKDDDIRGSF